MSAKIRRIVGWTLVGLLALFIVFNFQPVRVNFWYLLKVEVPAALLIFLSAALGAGAVYALRFLRDLRKDKAPPP
jgi:uncharacterized integral membrane protein